MVLVYVIICVGGMLLEPECVRALCHFFNTILYCISSSQFFPLHQNQWFFCFFFFNEKNLSLPQILKK